jgi:hypothetical protein
MYKGHGVKAVEPRSFHPKGILVATLHEHKGSVNSLAVSRDNLFVASGVHRLYMLVSCLG